MTELAKQARRDYHNRWNREHPDAVRKHQADYWERKAAAAKEEQNDDRD